MRVFISGPRTANFSGAAQRLDAAGHEHERPTWHGEPDTGSGTWRIVDASPWIGTCVGLVGTCQGVALVGDWRTSRGCMLEVGYALGRGLLVLPLEAWLDGTWCGPERHGGMLQILEEAVAPDEPRS